MAMFTAIHSPVRPTMNSMNEWREWLGVEITPSRWSERLVSLIGGLMAIFAMIALTKHALGLTMPSMLIASMGASAVLLFAVPHGPLSQPWPVLAGHTSAAIIGVTCARMIGNPDLAAGCAVGLAIGAMVQFRCIHPPGGATALTAVIGGKAVRELGYGFVWRPVLLDALLLTALAIVVNAPFSWRRYPAHWVRRGISPAPAPAVAPTHAQVVAALSEIGSFVDISEDDLRLIVQRLSAPARPES